MKLLNKFNWNNFNYIDPMRFHIQAEVSKVCFEIKETILGDPQFNKIDIEYLMSSECIDMLLKKLI
jgi:gamma-glutamyltranspeptidase